MTLCGAGEAVEREEKEEGAERFGALDGVGDGGGLERVKQPEEGGGEREGERARRVAASASEWSAGDFHSLALAATRPRSAAEQAEERERGQCVYQEIGDVVAPDIGAAQGVVECEGGVDQRPLVVMPFAGGKSAVEKLRIVGFSAMVRMSSKTKGPWRLFA